MTISTQTSGSLLDSVLSAQKTRQDMDVSLLKKAEDNQTQEAQQDVQMLEKTGPQAVGSYLDTYA